MIVTNYISLFSGIEAASVAWEPLGFTPLAFSEIEPFPCAVLKYHYPNVENLGDITKIKWGDYGTVDIIVGGSPCQSFSISGNRESLSGESGLMYEYIRAIQDVRPRWLLWENVPGVFSTKDGAFTQLLTELSQCGYSLAWRVLDAQFFGVPQRRRRVFLVGYFGEGGAPAAVLYERESLSQHAQSSKENHEENPPGDTRYPREAIAFAQNLRNEISAYAGDGHISGALTAKYPSKNSTHLWVINDTMTNAAITKNKTETLLAHSAKNKPMVLDGVIRQLTPLECERLQGFPDGYTDIPYRDKPHSPKSVRYKALGNSMAVPVMRWLGKRIMEVDKLL